MYFDVDSDFSVSYVALNLILTEMQMTDDNDDYEISKVIDKMDHLVFEIQDILDKKYPGWDSYNDKIDKYISPIIKKMY